MIRTVLHLEVRPGSADALVEAFRELRILEESVQQPGCSSAEIAISGDGREAIVTATWDDEHAYELWTAHGDREARAAAINPHLVVPLSVASVGKIYQVRHAPQR